MVEGESEVAAAVGGGEHEDVGGDSEVGDGEGDDFVDSDYELGTKDVGMVEEEGRTEEEGRARKRKIGETVDVSELREVDTDVIKEQPTILPPLQVPFEDEQCPEACVTQEEVQRQTPAAPVYMPGPSMYQQLTMSNPQSGIQIRAAPPFRGRQILPYFSTTSRAQSGTIHPVIIERGHKFLDLNQFK
ncbi:hypothetical protein Salat_1742100 [Sesamum alatum]|uniref:Uncharacterized protein n=1 Tax=Sesamum alatum TaxID=300844 RepID=A0AAE2CKG7_9LAMI|nr:hypothetical protein Salat_1742100 [Sesamum alatum]